MSRKKKIKNVAQLEFSFERPREQDRNYHLGGKSFYFFDFDDNVAHLATTIVLFHKETGEEIEVSSAEFARIHHSIGKSGAYKDYSLDINDETGSFRNFRDLPVHIETEQSFVKDIESAIAEKDFLWKAPSWNCFFHATYNQRPISVITARGHGKSTIKAGINLMVQDGHLPIDPNYLSIYPVSNPEVRKHELGDPGLLASVPELKRTAIRESVEEAIRQYGHNPYHRFGMSDDDPKNIELITEEMRDLKRKYSEMSFFVIQTFSDGFTKNEVLTHRTREIVRRSESTSDQLPLFLG